MGRKLQSSEVADAHERLNDYLEPSEVDRLLDAARDSPNGIRDYALVLLTYRKHFAHVKRCDSSVIRSI
jgi:site-specific recombinase XerD